MAPEIKPHFPMTLDFVFAPIDWLRLCWLTSRATRIPYFVAVLSLGYALLRFLLVGYGFQVSMIVFLAGNLVAASAIFFGLMSLVLAALRIRIQIMIDENYLTAETKQKSEWIPWSSFMEAKEERSLFWFKSTHGNIFVPKRAFANEDAMTSFRSLVKLKMRDHAELRG